jgi:hypothetical protein
VYINHYNNINVDNGYNRWGNRAQAGQLPANRQSKQVGNTTFAKGANNNVYAGRDGQVYRKGEGGDWQKYQGKGDGWSDVGDGNRGGNRGDNRPSAGNQLPGETRGSLDRQAQSRDLGAQRAQQYRSSAGFQGGGGGRTGGGGRRR